ncbi:hypothetical protein BFW01_g9641 [Lasiodiplodia theobromae]|nr:hypothetical protein BFW01_g9641 [Lasiodiplodia theobromae]
MRMSELISTALSHEVKSHVKIENRRGFTKMPSMSGTHPATIHRQSTTNTDHEAALLDEPWNEVPHNAPQTLKAGVGS